MLQETPSLKSCLQLKSRLAGSIEKLFQPSRDGQGWCGFCSVCKRPLEVRVADDAASPVRPTEVVENARGRFAFLICLWGSSKDYVLGALVLGFSIKRTKTKHSLVCLHTDDVPAEHLKLLQIFWECREVKHMEVACAKRLSTDDRIEESRFSKVFTKLRALEQEDFEKVLVMDIDLLVLSSIDKLFELPAPAALKRGMNRGKWPYKHGDDVDGATFFSGREPGKMHSWGQGTGINAGVMLLAPNKADFLKMEEELLEPYHPGHVRGNGPEQDYLSRFFADRPWRHISVEYNFQVHHMYNALHPLLDDAERLVVCENYQSVRVVHFSGDAGVKPWTRCLQKSFGWPVRDQDEEYVQQFLSDYHSYLLWVKKDPERWSRMERSMFDDSSLAGFTLGEDGVIYFEEEGVKKEKETAPEAVAAVMDATRYFLKSWFDTLEAARIALKRDLVEELLSFPPRESVPEGPGDSGASGSKDLWRGSSSKTWQEAEIPQKDGSSDRIWAKNKGPRWPNRWDEAPRIRTHKANVFVQCSIFKATVRFTGADWEEQPSEEELRGLHVKDGSRVRYYSEKELAEEDGLSCFSGFVDGIEPGDFLLFAALDLEPKMLEQILAVLKSKSGDLWRIAQAKVPSHARAMAVAHIVGQGYHPQVNFGSVQASAEI